MDRDRVDELMKLKYESEKKKKDKYDSPSRD